MNLEDLHKKGENQHLEFKATFGKETVETVAAFSNTSGGTILIGVNENGVIKGIPVSEELLKEWVNTIKQATQPQIFPDITILKSEGRLIAAIKVQEYPRKPVSCKGKYYKRVGASNHLISTDEIVEMQLYSLNSSFDSFPVQPAMNELDESLVEKFFSQLGNAGRISLNDDPQVNLKKTGLIRDGQLTFAALLLFGEHHTGIRIGRFKTSDIIIDDILIKSPLVVAVDEAMTFIKKSISIRYDFTGELRRTEIWQYPLPVLRELLMNAVIHKDYRDPTDIMIKIFDNHIQFTNPGALMGGLKPVDLMSGNYTAIHRNKLLAEAFYLRGDIEKFGTGFFRIQTALREFSGLRIQIESIHGYTRTELQFSMQNEDSFAQDNISERLGEDSEGLGEKGKRLGEEEQKLGEKGKKLRVNQKRILQLLKENPKISSTQISTIINISQNAIGKNISKLKKMDLIVRVGAARGGYWKITDKGIHIINLLDK
jgi:ATP-dependent DNA helicase RecG